MALGVSSASAANFESDGIPSKVAPSAIASNFTVRFAPSTQGRVTASLQIANDSTTTPYVVKLAGYAWTPSQTLSQTFGPAAGGNTITLTNVPFGCGGADITNVTVGGVSATITGQGTNWVSVIAPTGTAGTTVSVLVQSTCLGNTLLNNVYTYNPAGAIFGEDGVTTTNVYTIGAGANTNGTSDSGPVNIYYRSRHMQFIYTSNDLSTAGFSASGRLTKIGFNVVAAPLYAMPSYLVRMKHTTTSSLSAFESADGLIVCSSNAAYSPTAGGFDMIPLTTPFDFNGTNNILLDIAFPLVETAFDSSGQSKYDVAAGRTWHLQSDGADQSYLFSGGAVQDRLPQLRLEIESTTPGSLGVMPTISPSTGGVEVTISGSNLCNGTIGDVRWVTLCGVTATVQSVASHTQMVVRAGAGGYGLGDVVVQSTEFGTTTRSNAFTYLSAPSSVMRMMGVNGSVIASSNAPTTAAGNDFGRRQFNRSYTNTFYVRNDSTQTLTIASWTTNGTGAGAYRIDNMPATVNAGASNAFQVVFSPTDMLVYTAAVVIVNNSLYDNPYRFFLQGEGVLNEQSVTFDNPGAQNITNRISLAASSSSGLPVTFAVESGPALLDGTNVSFIGVGSVTIMASQTGNASYASASTGQTFNVSLVPAVITADGLNTTYDGTPKNVSITTVPVGLTVLTNYLTSAGSPIQAGTNYFVRAEIKDSTYAGYQVFTQVIAQAGQALSDFTPANASVFVTTNVVMLSATSDAGLTPSFAVHGGPGVLDGSVLTFTGAGAVTVRVEQAGNSNYLAAISVTNVFTVNRTAQEPLSFLPSATMSFASTNALTASGGSGTGAVTFAVQGGPGTITGVTNVAITSGTGTVTLVATKAADDRYSAASVTAEVACAKAAQYVDMDNPGGQSVTNRVGLSGTASSGLPVVFSVVTGPGKIEDGTNLSFTTSGAVQIRCRQGGNDDYLSAETSIFIIANPLPATVTLQSLAQFYDGQPKPVSAMTDPEGVDVTFTYDGGTHAPTEVGSYGVAAETDDAIYYGSATGTLVISYMPMMDVQTEAGQSVPNGASVNPVWGTDFGTVATNVQRTLPLAITNSGLGDLVITGVGVSGSGAQYFSVSNLPPAVASHSASNFLVYYAPTELGAHTMALSITNSGTNTPFVINVGGTGIKPGEIFLLGSSMRFDGRYPDELITPIDGFSVVNTNIAASPYSYSNQVEYSGAADWLTISAPTGHLIGGAQQAHTGAVSSITGMNAGDYWATNWIVSGEAANAPVPMLVKLTIQKGTQHIEFAEIPPQVTTNTVGLSASASSSLPVSFRVVNSPAVI
ncbi:MAG TPA: hypothetical protein DCS43_11500, partial [Verrucomicrobia bacterium]|nr:hypothetical protein [Verrucomicrobiota bacterium]